MSRFLSSVVAVVLLSGGIPVSAQEPSYDGFPSAEYLLSLTPVADGGDATGNLQCFDHYVFGSVQADLQPNVLTAVPSTEITFAGDLVNENPYPLVDGTLFVKIFKRDEATFAVGDGNPVVDQFVAAEDITLPANGSVSLSYSWEVPQNAAGGDYYAAYFFATSDRYNLMGLSFTDDVVGNTADFSVESDNRPVVLLKDRTTVAGLDHHFAAVPRTVSATETVEVITNITNPTDETKVLPIQWQQYAWDAMNPDHLRNTKTEVITLEPGETRELSYTVEEVREPIVFLTAITEDMGARSVLNIRYVRDDIPETRINFPSVDRFPLPAGEETLLFACAHSTNVPLVEGNTLTLTLTDRAGDLIHEYQYQGGISGAMAGFGETFVSATNQNYALLTATLERDGVVVEDVTIEYDCRAIDPDSCLPEMTSEDGDSLLDTVLSSSLLLFSSVVIILLLLYLVWSVHKRHDIGPYISKPKNENSINPLLLLLIPLAVAGMLMTAPTTTEAKSVSWSSGVLPDLAYCWNRDWNKSNYPPGDNANEPNCTTNNNVGGFGYANWARALSDAVVTVEYGATLTNLTTGASLSDGSSVAVGDQIRITSRAHQSADISWFGTGYSADSPNGEWRANANPRGFQSQPYSHNPSFIPFGQAETVNLNGPVCDSKDFVGGTTIEDHVPLVVHPTTNKTTSMSSNLSCGSVSVNSAGTLTQTCTVTGPGNVTAGINFPATYGKFYYRYYDNRTFIGDGFSPPGSVRTGCYGNQTALRAPASFNIGGSVPSGGVPPSDYQLNIPARNISFSLTAVSSNNPPAAPSISGPTTGQINQNHTFTVSGGSDPDGDNFFYYRSNAACSAASQRLPGSGWTSGSETFTTSWGTAGTYNVYAFTQDSNGARSGCDSHQIVISSAPTASGDLKVNGSDGPLTEGKGDDLNLSWSHSNAGTCNVLGDGLPGGQLSNVPSTGSHTIPGGTVGAGAETYALNCTPGVLDSVAVTITNTAPNPPSITQTAGNNEEGSPQTFQFTGTDPDGDQIYYEIQWAPTSGPIISTPGSGYVNSGVSRNGNNTWPTAGSVTIRARTVDADGARSNWASLPVTINPGPPPPPPTAQLEVRVVPGGWGTNSITVGAEDTLQFRWSSTNASSCTATAGSGFSTGAGNPTSGTDTTVITPTAGNSTTFNVNCDGADSGIIITSELGDLSLAAVSMNVNQASFDPGTMSYGNATVRFTHSNVNSMSAVPATTATLDHDGGFTVNAPGLNGGEEYASQVVMPITDVPVGSFSADLTVNEPQTISEKTRANNTVTISDAVAPPNPGLFITANRIQVRDGDSVELEWGASLVYPMDCQVQGPGVDIDPASLPGNTTTPGITAKSEYTLNCTEPISGTNFSADVTVETVGSLEEI